MGKVLIIENNDGLYDFFHETLLHLGHETQRMIDLSDQTPFVSKYFDLIVLDPILDPKDFNMLPSGVGIQELSKKSEVLRIIKGLSYEENTPKVIIATKIGFNAEAKKAIDCGVVDYIYIPKKYVQRSSDGVLYDPYLIKSRFESAVKWAFREAPLMQNFKCDNIIGDSLELNACLQKSFNAAKSDINILITGESGTGKELLANFIVTNSSRSDKKFMTLNCAAITDSLADSELFGIEANIATTVKARKGKIELAHEGTLFLDEIGDIPLSMQAKLLRVLQEKKYYSVGGVKEIKSNFRLICATNQNLESMIAEKKFRADLLYRINAVTINLPPLRSRTKDIEDLVTHFLRREGYKEKLNPIFLEALKAYDWPGNIRELENVIRSVLSINQNDKELNIYHLPGPIRIAYATDDIGGLWWLDIKALINKKREMSAKNEINKSTIVNNDPTNNQEKGQEQLRPVSHKEDSVLRNMLQHDMPSWKDYSSKSEKIYLETLMVRVGYNIEKASAIYGVSPSQLYKILKKANLSTKPLSLE